MVAPPDAVAATAIARRIGLPRRIVTVLEGESLLNDATALVALRTAIVGSTGVVALGLDFALAAGGGVAVGLAAYALVAFVRRQVTDPVLDTSVSLLTPFAAYVVAEEIHASGVLAVVVAGLLLGHNAPVLQTASSRISERLNWRTISFLLENTVFLLIGLQARWIFAEVGEHALLGRIVGVCAAAIAATVLLRPIWIFAFRLVLLAPTRGETSRPVPSWKTAAVTSWAGMRGVVTLAAAFVIPEDFEHREVLLLIAFTVTAATLFGQGLTLPWLARRLQVPAPDPGRTPWRAPPCSRTPPRPASPCSTSTRGRRTPTTRSRRCAAVPSSATSPPGSAWAGPPRTRRRRARSTRGCGWRCSRPNGAGSSRCATRAGCRTRWSRTCCTPSTSRSRCSTWPPTGRTASARTSSARRRGRGGARPDHRLRAPPRGPGRRRRARGRGLHRLRRGGHHLGAPADVPGLRAGRLLRLLAAAALDDAPPADRSPRGPLRGAGETWRWCFVDQLVG